MLYSTWYQSSRLKATLLLSVMKWRDAINVSYVGDDFTVETALEDLEFGFTVIKSTQKVRKLSYLHNSIFVFIIYL